ECSPTRMTVRANVGSTSDGEATSSRPRSDWKLTWRSMAQYAPRRVDEAPVHFTELGGGEPVVLVHGSYEWGARTWREQLPLADEFRLRIVDRRGFGRSPTRG